MEKKIEEKGIKITISVMPVAIVLTRTENQFVRNEIDKAAVSLCKDISLALKEGNGNPCMRCLSGKRLICEHYSFVNHTHACTDCGRVEEYPKNAKRKLKNKNRKARK